MKRLESGLAIVSNVPEAEIGQIKKEYITDRIKASVDTFGSQPEFYDSIITTAVAVLSLLVSKVLRKAAELSEKLHDTRQEQALPPEPKPMPLPKVQKQMEQKIPPKPEMSASAAAYPRLHKIYKELVRQNETIFEAGKERNILEEKQGSLKGLSKLTKKGELQSEIDRINERIDLLKMGIIRNCKAVWLSDGAGLLPSLSCSQECLCRLSGEGLWNKDKG